MRISTISSSIEPSVSSFIPAQTTDKYLRYGGSNVLRLTSSCACGIRICGITCFAKQIINNRAIDFIFVYTRKRLSIGLVEPEHTHTHFSIYKIGAFFLIKVLAISVCRNTCSVIFSRLPLRQDHLPWTRLVLEPFNINIVGCSSGKIKRYAIAEYECEKLVLR